MLNIKLNDLAHRYDVYHIFKLFYSFEDIKFVEEDYDYKVVIQNERILIKDPNSEKEASYNIREDMKLKDEVKSIIFTHLKNKTGKMLPWGVLIGIRPTKIVLDMLDKGFCEEDIISILKEKYFAREDKAKLCLNIAKMERERVNRDQNTVSIYIGMPFCPTRCLYCSFASNPIGKCKSIVKDYLNALTWEINKIREFIDKKNLNIECVYFGGGTPTSVEDNDFEYILSHIYKSFVKDRKVAEFTVECGRPDSINERKLLSMKKYSVSRISINPQSMNDDTLKLIGRNHTVQDVVDKFYLARKLGFNNINMDIIVGLPNEDLKHVNNTCSKILKLNPDSLTVHGMSIKRASILYEKIVTGKINIKQQQELNEMYDKTVSLAKKLNMKPYYMYRQKNMVGNMENIGYSKASKEGLYNIQMIEERQTIIALGADAVTKVIDLDINKIKRYPNIKDVREYIKRLDEKVQGKIELLNTLY